MPRTEEAKVVIITGSSTGIGRIAAESLAREGYRVFASMRDPGGRNAAAREELERLQPDCDITVIEMDVVDEQSVRNAMRTVVEMAGRVDVLVNNAGIMPVGITEGYTLEQVRDAFDVNVYGSMRTIRAVLPTMRRQQSGLLIQVTSLAGRLVFPFFGVYCASKFAAEAMAEGYRYELSGSGIDSVIVEPGPFPSQLIARSIEPAEHERLDAYGDRAAAPGSLLSSFGEFLASTDAPDSRLVAEVISSLIETPAHKRPLRTVAGLDYGVARLNEKAAPFQRALLAELDLEVLDPRADADLAKLH